MQKKSFLKLYIITELICLSSFVILPKAENYIMQKLSKNYLFKINMGITKKEEHLKRSVINSNYFKNGFLAIKRQFKIGGKVR
jgi:hypothetical protein